MFEFYNELEEETEDFVGVEHVRVTKQYLTGLGESDGIL